MFKTWIGLKYYKRMTWSFNCLTTQFIFHKSSVLLKLQWILNIICLSINENTLNQTLPGGICWWQDYTFRTWNNNFCFYKWKRLLFHHLFCVCIVYLIFSCSVLNNIPFIILFFIKFSGGRYLQCIFMFDKSYSLLYQNFCFIIFLDKKLFNNIIKINF